MEPIYAHKTITMTLDGYNYYADITSSMAPGADIYRELRAAFMAASTRSWASSCTTQSATRRCRWSTTSSNKATATGWWRR